MKSTVNNCDKMRINTTSGHVFSFYLSILFALFVILASVSDKAHAKSREERSNTRRNINVYIPKGCLMFGRTCFGGHGKRSDSTVVRRDTLQASISQNFQESEVSPSDKLFYVFPNEFWKHSDQFFMRTRKDAQQFDVYHLPSLMDQWVRVLRYDVFEIRDIKADLDRKRKGL